MRWFWLILILASCGKSKENRAEVAKTASQSHFKIDYAKGFKVLTIDGGYILEITKAWPDADKTFRYLLYKDEEALNSDQSFDFKLKIPIEKAVVTSTTHIPSLDTLGVLDKLVGFPNTNYISTYNAIQLIKSGQIVDIGQNESLNTELLVELQPDVIVTFAVKGENKSLENIKQAGIPILYNADWVESEPLGKAEWIKFFGLLFDKVETSQKIFEGIAIEYQRSKLLAEKAGKQPTVLSGALWKDQWYLPGGNSWQAQLIGDANAKYIYASTQNSGSLSFSFETVFEKARNVDYWVAPAQYTSYDQMLDQQSHYAKFKAFQDKKIFTFSSTVGANGGVLYYELAPNRPDLVLKDLIHIFHPELLDHYQPRFFKPLEP